jgi:hypothetical protein
MRDTLASIMLAIGAVLLVGGLWMGSRAAPGQNALLPGLLLFGTGALLKATRRRPGPGRRDRNPFG